MNIGAVLSRILVTGVLFDDECIRDRQPIEMYQYRLLVMVSVADNSMDDYFNH